MLILFYSESDNAHDRIESSIKNHSILHAYNEDEARNLLNIGSTQIDIFIVCDEFSFTKEDRLPQRVMSIGERCTSADDFKLHNTRYNDLRVAISSLLKKAN